MAITIDVGEIETSIRHIASYTGLPNVCEKNQEGILRCKDDVHVSVTISAMVCKIMADSLSLHHQMTRLFLRALKNIGSPVWEANAIPQQLLLEFIMNTNKQDPSTTQSGLPFITKTLA